MDNLRAYLYYILVGIVSIIVLVFMPMMGSVAGLEWALPTTAVGWIVYTVSKLSSASFNIILFHLFNKQGKLNILENTKYKEALKLLREGNKTLVQHPRSPKEYYKDIYGKKCLSIFLVTLLGTFGLSQAILTFDIKEFIVQAIAVTTGIIMGILQMKDTEYFWTEEYYDYAVEMTKGEQENV